MNTLQVGVIYKLRLSDGCLENLSKLLKPLSVTTWRRRGSQGNDPTEKHQLTSIATSYDVAICLALPRIPTALDPITSTTPLGRSTLNVVPFGPRRS
jgi:hypothetical protein